MNQEVASRKQRAEQGLGQVDAAKKSVEPLRDDSDRRIKVARAEEDIRRSQAESKVRDNVTITFVVSFMVLIFLVSVAICVAPFLELEEKRIGYLFEVVKVLSPFLALVLGYYFGSNVGPK
ncbi:MAG: hypothetical protein P9F75_19585 [Candidatus Contendobacter sp.]|nr:hypothetical protein [Candidatus Contendobacter sp.]